MAAEKFVGIEIGGTKLQLVVGDARGIIETHKRYTIEPSAGAGGIQANISACFQEWQEQYLPDVAAIGIGFGGPVDWSAGKIRVSHQVGGWESFDLKRWLEELSGKPVCIDNDANAAALGEGIHGWGREYNNLFYMTLGSGIGGGLFTEGKIYHGMAPGELEIGHLRLDKKGTTLESRCSGWAVNHRVQKHIESHPKGILAQLAGSSDKPLAALIKPAAQQGDRVAKGIIDEIADDLAFALSHLVHLLHPEVIVLGGGLSLLGDDLCKPIEAGLPDYLLSSFLPAPPIRIAILGENVVPVGAIELAKIAWKQTRK